MRASTESVARARTAEELVARASAGGGGADDDEDLVNFWDAGVNDDDDGEQGMNAFSS